MLKGTPPGTTGGANFSGWPSNILFSKFLDHSISYVKPSKMNMLSFLTIMRHTCQLKRSSSSLVDVLGRLVFRTLVFLRHVSHFIMVLQLAAEPTYIHWLKLKLSTCNEFQLWRPQNAWSFLLLNLRMVTVCSDRHTGMNKCSSKPLMSTHGRKLGHVCYWVVILFSPCI